MKLFQYEQFFSNHFDTEVKTRGTYLISLIDELQNELMVHAEWANWPIIHFKGRMEELKLRAIIHAIERHGGDKTKASKWLGISRDTMYDFLTKWNKSKASILSNENKESNPIASNHAPATNRLPNNQNSTPSRK